MIRKTVQLTGRRSSIKLELEFWTHLGLMARERGVPVVALIRAIEAANPGTKNLSSCLRRAALQHARWRAGLAKDAGLDVLNWHGRTPSLPSLSAEQRLLYAKLRRFGGLSREAALAEVLREVAA